MQNNIIYIGGYGRSGSTVLEKLLTAHPNITGGGEIFRMGEIFSDHMAMCTCGEMLINCSVWGQVRIVAEKEGVQFGGFSGLHAALMRVEGRSEKNLSYTTEDLKVWVRLNNAAFTALRCASPSAIWVVDSSKTARGAALRPARLMESRADVRFIKLIRSARSVLHSVSKGTNRALENNKINRNNPIITLQHQLRAYAGWIMANTVAEDIAQKLGKNALEMSYENMVAKPNRQLTRLINWLELAYPDDWEKRMVDEPRHMISGNRNRFRSEIVQRITTPCKSDVIGDVGLGIGRSLAKLGVL